MRRNKLRVNLQPRNDQCGRRTCNLEVKANTEEEATVTCTLRGHRGKGGGTRVQSNGVNWGTSTRPTPTAGTRTYSYNADGDQTGETWVGASPSEKITYTYDADDELTGAADSFATLTFTYNGDGELQTDGADLGADLGSDVVFCFREKKTTSKPFHC